MTIVKPQNPLEPLLENCRYFEYTQAADPIGSGAITKLPFANFGSELHRTGGTRIIPLDVSEQLRCPGPATSPALCANFVRILAGESLATDFNATSLLFYVMYGSGRTEFDDLTIPWQTGDFVVLPVGKDIRHFADSDSAFYLVHDQPLLTYLGVTADRPCFKPTLYTAEDSLRELAAAQKAAEMVNRNRISVLLANKAMDQTLTVTHTLWAMLGVLPKGAVQLPHRHQSVALDLILDCAPGCYTLVGPQISATGRIVNPTRVDWQPYSAFITPPGYWHAHYNDSGEEAHLLPLQDAGLQTYLRSLDIKFVLPDGSVSG
ncbi:cupin [Methylomonas sp. EFPC1]|uniref:cupin n=1 Tax=Methylomonas sp. EFPC1 TaxID=2812647 RepID=UPI0019684744|nr:cupin [Methylomonas sp. EFPC1]QSB00784.1 cupin [Methylomonas sp. EFPC1]